MHVTCAGTRAQVRALKQQANALADEAASQKFNVQSAQQEGDNLRGLIVEVGIGLSTADACRIISQLEGFCMQCKLQGPHQCCPDCLLQSSTVCHLLPILPADNGHNCQLQYIG